MERAIPDQVCRKEFAFEIYFHSSLLMEHWIFNNLLYCSISKLRQTGLTLTCPILTTGFEAAPTENQAQRTCWAPSFQLRTRTTTKARPIAPPSHILAGGSTIARPSTWTDCTTDRAPRKIRTTSRLAIRPIPTRPTTAFSGSIEMASGRVWGRRKCSSRPPKSRSIPACTTSNKRATVRSVYFSLFVLLRRPSVKHKSRYTITRRPAIKQLIILKLNFIDLLYVARLSLSSQCWSDAGFLKYV